MLGNFEGFFCHLQIFVHNKVSTKNSFRYAIRVSNSLDPDQARQFVGPDLGPNCLQKLSANKTSRQRVKAPAKVQLKCCLLKSSAAYFF